jgi:hypothetical protein
MFELFEYERVGEDQYLGRGSFNPNFDALRVGVQEVSVLIELDVLPDFKRRSNEPTVLTVAVARLGRAVAVDLLKKSFVASDLGLVGIGVMCCGWWWRLRTAGTSAWRAPHGPEKRQKGQWWGLFTFSLCSCRCSSKFLTD